MEAKNTATKFRPNCQISGPHCEQCGSTYPEDIDTGDGYSACCNEIVTSQHTCRDHHGEEQHYAIHGEFA